ncbi:MAG: PKD domain-containing protein [Candidatus Zixiibacteriota bacterium]
MKNKYTVPLPENILSRDHESDWIKVTRWIDPEGRQPESYSEWRTRVGEPGPFETEFIRKSESLKNDGWYVKILVVVNTALYPLIISGLDQYVLDLNAEGYEVEVYISSGGTPEEMREFLQERYFAGMKGCVFIGDLPIAWYEIFDCYDYGENEEFPCDYFYMDLDGNFRDSDNDDLYDHHYGDVTPEIWMGRLTAGPIAIGAVSEDSMIINYFNKNHLYRTGQLELNKRGLMYVDDDWAGEGDYWGDNMGLAYDTVEKLYDEYITFSDHYEYMLTQNYEFIQVCVHSSPYAHSFTNPDGDWGSTTNLEVKAIGPIAHFYNLFACSNSRFTAINNMGGVYIYGDDYGQASIGTTKTGSMLFFEYFYYPLSQGMTMGEALRDWYIDVAGYDGQFTQDNRCWHYGMTLQGDPTLMVSGWGAKFISTENIGWAPHTVDFLGLSEHTVNSWNWTFGNGNTSTIEAPSCTYDTPGIYDVSLQVISDSGHYYFHTLQDYVVVLADTIIGADMEAPYNDIFEYQVMLTNYVPLYRLVIPVEYSGLLDLRYDGYDTTGCRGVAFETLDYLHYNGNYKHMCLNLESTSALPAGTGTLLKLKFHVASGDIGQANEIDFDGYEDFIPRFYSSYVEYEPAVTSGSVTLNDQLCCVGFRGNVNCSTNEEPDISDITRLIDFLYLTHEELCCEEEADANGSGDLPDISDITTLIDYLYLSHAPLPSCP